MRRYTGIILPLLLLIGWWAAAVIINNPFVLPPPGSVMAVLLHPAKDILRTKSLFYNAFVSLTRVGFGFLIAVCIAIPLGIRIG